MKLSQIEQMQLVIEGLKKGFKYNGCSVVPDFTFGWDCCNEHDYNYQAGDLTRAECDKILRICIQDRGYWLLGWVYWLGVRIFGRCYFHRNKTHV